MATERQMTAGEIWVEEMRKRYRARATEVWERDGELADALRDAARDVGTDDERPGDEALLDIEPRRPATVAVCLAGTWMGFGAPPH